MISGRRTNLWCSPDPWGRHQKHGQTRGLRHFRHLLVTNPENVMLIQPPMRIIGRTLVTFPFIMSVNMVGSANHRFDIKQQLITTKGIKALLNHQHPLFESRNCKTENSPVPRSIPYLLFSPVVKSFAKEQICSCCRWKVLVLSAVSDPVPCSRSLNSLDPAASWFS